MNAFQEKIDEIESDMFNILSGLVEDFGKVSEHNSEKVLKIKNDEHMFNLDDDRYLVELNDEFLFDNDGHRYNVDFLSLDKIAQIVDGIESNIKCYSANE